MKSISVIALISSLLALPLSTKGQVNDDEEMYILSPFEVSRTGNPRDIGIRSSNQQNESYPVYNDLGGTVNDLDSTCDDQLVEAQGIDISFSVAFYDDLERVRKERLFEILDRIRTAVEADGSLHFEPGSVLIPPGDRKRLKATRKADLTSYAQFFISFDLEPGDSPFKRTMAVRRMIDNLKLDTDTTRVFYGDATPRIESPFEGLANDGTTEPLRSGSIRTSDIGATITHVTDTNHRVIQSSPLPAPVSLIKPADAVSIQFAIDVSGGNDADRQQTIEHYLGQVRDRLTSMADTRLEPGALFVRHGNQEVPFAARSSELGSQAWFRIGFPISDASEVPNRIQTIRSVVASIERDSKRSTIHFGPASLLVDNLNRYRTELISTIRKDVESMQAELANHAIVEPRFITGNSHVMFRLHSTAEIEVWIPFEYRFSSSADIQREEEKRQSEALRLEREHEVALAQAKRDIVCCAQCQKSN